MPLYEALIRRALAARERAEGARVHARRVRELAQLLRDADAGQVLLVHCAWCDRLQLGDEWLHLSDVPQGGAKVTDALIGGSSHGICPDCFRRVSESAQHLEGRQE